MSWAWNQSPTSNILHVENTVRSESQTVVSRSMSFAGVGVGDEHVTTVY